MTHIRITKKKKNTLNLHSFFNTKQPVDFLSIRQYINSLSLCFMAFQRQQPTFVFMEPWFSNYSPHIAASHQSEFYERLSRMVYFLHICYFIFLELKRHLTCLLAVFDTPLNTYLRHSWFSTSLEYYFNTRFLFHIHRFVEWIWNQMVPIVTIIS